MIADLLFPLFTAYSPNAADRYVTRQRGLAGVAVLLDLGIPPRRNNRLNCSPSERIVHFPLVVGAIAVIRVNRSVDLVEQAVDLIRVVTTVLGEYLRFNLLRSGIHRKVQHSPSATLAFAMLTHLPFAFAEDLQAGAVDHDVDRTFTSGDGERNTQLGGPLGQRRQVRYRQIDLHQIHQGASQLFGLAVRQPKQLTLSQQAGGGHVTVSKRPTDFRFVIVMLPGIDHVLVEPERNVASLHQRLVISSPVCDLVVRLKRCCHESAPSNEQADPILNKIRLM